MTQINTIPKPDEGLNISKLIIALNSSSDSPFSMQFSLTGLGKRTVQNDQGEDVDEWFPHPVYTGLFRIEGDNWSAWTPDAADSDNDYVANLVLNYLNLEKAPNSTVDEIPITNTNQPDTVES